LNHGFASYVGVVILKCLFGIKSLDLGNGKIELAKVSSTVKGTCTIHTNKGKIELEN
jgi:hypothetical protein